MVSAHMMLAGSISQDGIGSSGASPKLLRPRGGGCSLSCCWLHISPSLPKLLLGEASWTWFPATAVGLSCCTLRRTSAGALSTRRRYALHPRQSPNVLDRRLPITRPWHGVPQPPLPPASAAVSWAAAGLCLCPCPHAVTCSTRRRPAKLAGCWCCTGCAGPPRRCMLGLHP